MIRILQGIHFWGLNCTFIIINCLKFDNDKEEEADDGGDEDEEGLQIHDDASATKAKPGPTEAPEGITSPPMKSKVVKEGKDKKTNKTISFAMEGEVDDQPHVSCGSHYAHHCEDCISSPNRPHATSPRYEGDWWKNALPCGQVFCFQGR